MKVFEVDVLGFGFEVVTREGNATEVWLLTMDGVKPHERPFFYGYLDCDSPTSDAEARRAVEGQIRRLMARDVVKAGCYRILADEEVGHVA